LLSQLIRHRRIVWLLALRNVQDRYTGTLGGALWALLNPLLQLLVFWFVFGVGLRMQGETGQPFVLFLFCGLIPWMTFNEILASAAGSITSRAYLVKKIAFPMEILPYTHLVAALFTHAFMLVILAIMLGVHRVAPGAGLLLLPYYVVALCALAAGLAMLLAAAAVFFRDVLQGLGVLLNVWFWMTPIVWPPGMAAPSLKPMLDYNPFYYVVSGFRDSLLAPELMLPDPVQSIYFWSVVVFLWLAGALVFSRLKPSFADVL
jgi:lipopolysaccharide transport system permease protein/teichoic acid transport system permease protein